MPLRVSKPLSPLSLSHTNAHEHDSTFRDSNLEKHDIAQLLNLCPTDVEEAITLIPGLGARPCVTHTLTLNRTLASLTDRTTPSLEGRIDKDHLESLLVEVNSLKSFQD